MHNAVTGVISGLGFLGALTLDEKSFIPISCAAVIAGGVWWLGRKLQRLEDTQEAIVAQLQDLPCKKNGCSKSNHK